MTDVWSYVITGVAFASTYLIAERRVVGWYIGVFAVQPLWLAYALITGQYGFVVNAVVFTYVNVRGVLRWRALDREDARSCVDEEVTV